MENKILNDSTICPNEDILEKALGKKYKYYKTLMEKINVENLTAEWTHKKVSDT